MSALATAPRRYVVHAYPDIAGVDPHEWDALLAPDDSHATHRFIGVCQRSGVASVVVSVKKCRRCLCVSTALGTQPVIW